MCNLKGYDVSILQIKEKYAVLTIYLSSYYPELEEIIDKYLDLSSRTCEQCGKAADTIKIGGWWTTICKEYLDAK